MPIDERDADFIVESVREDGRPFRPSDWVERISSQLASYGADHRLHYADSAHPCTIEGAKCLCVKKILKEKNPAAYQFILKFAADNHLRILEDRRSYLPDTSGDRRSDARGERRSSHS